MDGCLDCFVGLGERNSNLSLESSGSRFVSFSAALALPVLRVWMPRSCAGGAPKQGTHVLDGRIECWIKLNRRISDSNMGVPQRRRAQGTGPSPPPIPSIRIAQQWPLSFPVISRLRCLDWNVPNGPRCPPSGQISSLAATPATEDGLCSTGDNSNYCLTDDLLLARHHRFADGSERWTTTYLCT